MGTNYTDIEMLSDQEYADLIIYLNQIHNK
jgi:hypothetical protein